MLTLTWCIKVFKASKIGKISMLNKLLYFQSLLCDPTDFLRLCYVYMKYYAIENHKNKKGRDIYSISSWRSP